MKNITDYGSMNVHPGIFLLDKFLQSDEPGTLAWLDIDETDLNNDILPLKEVEPRTMSHPCAAAKLNEDDIFCQRQCARCRNKQGKASGGIGLRDASNPESK